MKHPIQKLYKDDEGVLRFKGNKIVKYLLEKSSVDLNHIPMKGFSQEDCEQFAQLIGYSLSGFGDLSYVSDETYKTASKIAKNNSSEIDARIEYLSETLEMLIKGLQKIAPNVFKNCKENGIE